MKFLKFSFLIFVFLLFCFNSNYAQIHFAIGGGVGNNINLINVKNIDNVDVVQYGIQKTTIEYKGNSYGISFSGMADIQFTPILGVRALLTFYDMKNFKATADYEKSYPLQGGGTVKAKVNGDLKVTLAYFGIEPLLRVKIPMSSFFILGGPAIFFPVSNKWDETKKMTLPAGVNWPETGTTEKTVKVDTIMKSANTRIELKFGFGYDWTIGPKLFISPEITFGFGPGDVVKADNNFESWKIHTIQLFIPVKFSIF